MSEKPEEPDFDFKDLEGQLKKLAPSPLKIDFLEELERDRSRVLSQGFPKEDSRKQWKRLVPILAAACMMIAGYLYAHFGINDPASDDADALAATVPESEVLPPQNSAIDPRFEPVSAQGYLIQTSSGGIINSDNGPVEKMDLEYRDAYHWRDPETGTNLRIFTPRQESLIVPVDTY